MWILRRAKEIRQKALHAQAVHDVFAAVDEFTQALVFQSKLLAYERGDNEVQSTHVKEAVRIVDQNRAMNRQRKLSSAFGGILFGSFVNALAGQAAAGNFSVPVIQSLLGVLGGVLIWYGIGDR